MSSKVTKPTIQQLQQMIRSKIQNFNWETNPDWIQQSAEFISLIHKYWIEYLKREPNYTPEVKLLFRKFYNIN